MRLTARKHLTRILLMLSSLLHVPRHCERLKAFLLKKYLLSIPTKYKFSSMRSVSTVGPQNAIFLPLCHDESTSQARSKAPHHLASQSPASSWEALYHNHSAKSSAIWDLIARDQGQSAAFQILLRMFMKGLPMCWLLSIGPQFDDCLTLSLPQLQT